MNKAQTRKNEELLKSFSGVLEAVRERPLCDQLGLLTAVHE